MTKEEKARIVAFTRLLGKNGDDREIFEEFQAYYESALNSFAEPQRQNEIKIVKRPF